MVSIDKAVSYVQSHGDAIEKARLVSILYQKPCPESVFERLAKLQFADGGFSYWLPGRSVSTVCDTTYMLTWFDDLSIHSGEMLDRAIDFIFRNQRPDGGWDEVEAIKELNPPGWLTPGRLETRVWLTAYCAHWLMRFGYAESTKAKACPADFLMARQEPSGRLAGYLRATWDALVLFAYHPGKESEAFRQALAVTETECMAEEWNAGYLFWLLRCLRDADLEASHPLVNRSIAALESKQQPDGSWQPEQGEEDYEVQATLEALRLLKDYGRV